MTISTSLGGDAIARRPNPRGQGGRLREEIVEAATALLAETGDVRQLTLRGVAKRVGIAATSVYLHFADVEQLAAAVAERCFQDLTTAEDAAERGIDDPVHALLARCRAYCRFALEHPGHYRVMVQVDLSLVRADAFDQLPGRRSFGALVRAIERCLDAGAARADSPPARLAALVWAAEHGLVSLRMARPRFPWPPLDGLVGEAVGRLVGLESAVPARERPHPPREETGTTDGESRVEGGA